MAMSSRLRLINPLTHLARRHFSSILNPNSATPLSSAEKTRAALSLVKSEPNPERIIEICRAAELTPDVHLDRVTISVAISRLTDLNYLVGVRSFLEELKKGRPDLKNERFYSHAIVLYGEAGMLNDAVTTFKEMDKRGITRTVKSLNAVLFSCILGKDCSELRRIFIEFPKKYGIEPNLDTYNMVIKAFCESGSSSSVFSIIAEMEGKKIRPNAVSFGHLLAGHYKEEKYDDIGRVLELMKKHGVRQGVNTYNIRIQSLCKLKRSSEARALIDGMVSRGLSPNSVTYTHLIHGFCKEGNLDEAKKTFAEMKSAGCRPDSESYFTLMHFLCQSGDFDTALEVCQESVAKGWFPKFSTMKSLVNGLVSVSKIDEARELVGQVKRKFSKNADLWRDVEAALPS